MAKGAVKLSILSSYNKSGTDQAEKALERFAKKYGQVNAETKAVTLDESAAAFARQSIAADQAAAKLDQFSGAALAVGGALTKGVTVPVVGAGALAVSAAAGMESSFANVRKTLDTTEEGYQNLYNACVEMSKVHPISASAVADIMALGAQLGISEGALVGFAETAYGMDIATDLDAGTAATELAQFANICGTAQTELSRVGSAVVALGNTSATTESNIMDMGMRIAASGTQAGMSEADILALSASLASLGMEAEAGGTAMSTTINQIDKDVATNGKNLETWASLAGQSVGEFVAAWKAGGDSTTEAFAKVVQGMAKTSDEGGNLTVLLEELGITGIRQSDAMKRLASSGDLLTDSIKEANTAYAENTALGQEVANFEDTLANKWETTKNKMQAAAIVAGGPLCDALSDIIDDAQPLVQASADLAQGFADMDSGGQKTVLTIAAIAAATGPAVMGMGKLAGAGSSVLKVYADITAALAKKAAAEAAGTASTSRLGSALSGASTKARGFATASNLAKAGVAALAVAVTAFAVTQAAEYIRKQEEMKKATAGLKNAQLSAIGTAKLQAASTQQLIDKTGEFDASTQDMVSHVESASSGLAASGELYRSVASGIDQLRESQAQLSQSIQETFSQAYSSNAQLDVYMATIDSLANKSGLSAQEQAQLKVAVDGLNSACGTAYSIVDAENGVLADQSGIALETTDSIKKLVEAKKLQNQVEALNSAYTDTLKSQQEAAKQLADALTAQKAAQDELNDCLDSGGQAYEVYQAKLDMANQKVGEAQSLYDSAAQSAAGYDGQLTLLAMAEQQGADSNAAWLAQHSQVGAVMSANGQDVSAFAQSLDDAGIKMADFGNLGDDVLAAMATNWDGSLVSLAQTCRDKGVEIPQSLRDGIMSGSGEVANATGVLKDAAVLELAGGDVELAAQLLGHDIDDGLKQGILDGTSGPQDAISKMSEEAKSKAKEMWQSHSPSRFMQSLGNDIDQGLANGISEGAGGVTSAIASMMQGAQSGLSDFVNGASTAGADFVNALGGAISAGGQFVADTAGGVATWAVNAATGSSNAAGSGNLLTSTFAGGVSGLLGSATNAAASMAGSAVTSASGSANASGGGSRLTSTFAGAINVGTGSAKGGELGRSARNSLRDNADGSGAGSFMGEGFVRGISGWIGSAVSAAANLARSAIDKVKAVGREGSPWKTTIESGGFFSQGFAVGIENETHQAVTAAQNLANDALSAAQARLDGGLTMSYGAKGSASVDKGAAQVQALLNAQYMAQVNMLNELKQIKSLVGSLAANSNAPTSERELARRIQRLAAMNV